MIRTDLYQLLFGKSHIKDGDVISLAEHGRVGGVSTGQPFKFVSNIETPPTDSTRTNPSLVLGYVDGKISTLTETIGGIQYQQTVGWTGNLITSISEVVQL